MLVSRQWFRLTLPVAMMMLGIMPSMVPVAVEAQSMTPPRSSDMELIAQDTAGRRFYLDKSSLAFDEQDTIYYWTKVVHSGDMMQIHGKPVVYSMQRNRQQCDDEVISDSDLVYHYDGENNLLGQFDPSNGKGAKATLHKPEPDTIEEKVFTFLCKRQANGRHGEILSRLAAQSAKSSKSPVEPRAEAPGDFREELWTAAAQSVLGYLNDKMTSPVGSSSETVSPTELSPNRP